MPWSWLAGGGVLAGGAYAVYVLLTWRRYGNVAHGRSEDRDELLDRFLPAYEVVERHHVRIAAPAEIALQAAKEMDLLGARVVRLLVRAREWILRSGTDEEIGQGGLLAQALSLGWGVLEDVPGSEVVVGAVTKPWEPDVTFRALPSEDFAVFEEPGWVKIIWSLRADPVGGAESIFRTETRAVATDAWSRARFRRYWAWVSPGVWLIRRTSLGPLKRESERRAREARET